MSETEFSLVDWLLSGEPVAAIWFLLGWAIALALAVFLWRASKQAQALAVEKARLDGELDDLDAARDDLAVAKTLNGELERKLVEQETTLREREKALAEMRQRMEKRFPGDCLTHAATVTQHVSGTRQRNF